MVLDSTPYAYQSVDAFYRKCLRLICGIKDCDRFENRDSLVIGIEKIFIRTELHRAGQLVRIEDSLSPKKVLGQLSDLKRRVGHPILSK